MVSISRLFMLFMCGIFVLFGLANVDAACISNDGTCSPQSGETRQNCEECIPCDSNNKCEMEFGETYNNCNDCSAVGCTTDPQCNYDYSGQCTRGFCYKQFETSTSGVCQFTRDLSCSLCGDNICDAGLGEATSLDLFIEGKCNEDCNAGFACQIDKDCKLRAGLCTTYHCNNGFCEYAAQPSCTTYPDDGNHKYYGAWGDYECMLQGKSTCADDPFYVNSCDGSSAYCLTSQSSCISNTECGQPGQNEVLQKSDGTVYAGGTPGVCMDSCPNSQINTCRVINGVNQKCVSCAYRPDLWWEEEHGIGTWNDLGHVKSGVWIDDATCGSTQTSPSCSSINGHCSSTTSNGFTLNGQCNPGLTCIQCTNPFTWSFSKDRCVSSCSSLNGVCSQSALNGVVLDANTDCSSGLTCVSCNPGYHFDPFEGCVSDCGEESSFCSSPGECCQINTDGMQLACTFGKEGTDRLGHCCPVGWYFDSRSGFNRCVQARSCQFCNDNPSVPAMSINPDIGGTPYKYWSNDLCVGAESPHGETCCPTNIYGVPGKYFQNVKVYDIDGNVVSG